MHILQNMQYFACQMTFNFNVEFRIPVVEGDNNNPFLHLDFTEQGIGLQLTDLLMVRILEVQKCEKPITEE